MDRLTKRQKGVLVAKDVLVQLEQSTVFPNRGMYILPSRSVMVIEKVQDWQQVIEQADLDGIACEACALGSVVLSKIRLFNRCPINTTNQCTLFRHCFYDLKLLSRELKQLLQVFDRQTLQDMEAVFEGQTCCTLGGKSTLSPQRITSFCKRYKDDPEKILKAIMNNIIRNKGRFILKGTKAKAKAKAKDA